MHPVGPQSPSVYWIRRVLLVVVAVALVVGLVWWIAGRGDSDTAAEVSQAGVTTTPALTGILAAPEDDTGPDGDDFDDGSLDEDLETTEGSETSTDSMGAVVITDDSGTATDAESSSDGPADGQTDESGTAGSDAAETTSPEPETTKTNGPGTTPQASEPKSTKPAKPTKPAKSTKPAKPTKTSQPATPSKPAKPSTTAPPKPSYDASGRLLCADDAISVKAITLSSSFPVGSQPRLGMAVTNTGSKSCVQDLSGSLQVYTVFTADGDRVWSTDDCFPGEGTDIRQLSPGSTANFLIKWAGTTSEPGCSAPRVQVPAGKYVLVAKLGKLKSAKLPFTMR